jgi:hypothetical protein
METNEESNEKSKHDQSALKAMVEKLDNRRWGTSGYSTHIPELQEILSQITPRVPVSILESYSPVDREGEITVEVRLSFTLERALL